MARNRIITETVTCDICGNDTADPTTVTIGWGRDQWEIDLCDKDNKAVSKTFDGWIANGRKVTGRRTRSGSSPAAGDTTAIREWARTNKMKVGDKGRISAEIRDAYAAANKK